VDAACPDLIGVASWLDKSPRKTDVPRGTPMVVESTKIGDFQAELLALGRVDLPIFVLSTTISSFGY
jgi:hypothetical protein